MCHAEETLVHRYEQQTLCSTYCSCQFCLCFMLPEPNMPESFVRVVRNELCGHMDTIDIHSVNNERVHRLTHTSAHNTHARVAVWNAEGAGLYT